MVINGRFLTQPLTGVQRYAIEMTRAIRRVRPQTEVLAPSTILHPELAKEFEATIVGRQSGYLWEQFELPRFLARKRKRPLLLNLANLAPVSYQRNVVVIHDVCPLRHPQWYGRRFRWAYRTLVPPIARRACQVITDSRFSATEICDVLKLAESQVAVVPCAAADVFHTRSEPDPPPLDAPYALTVGSFDRRKNVAGLMEAFKLLDLPDVRLVVIGRPNRVFAKTQLSDSQYGSRVRVETGADDRALRSWYSHARLFVFPSLYEGFGLPPLEAMACGCPCLISPCGALAETFGDAASYCDPRSVQDMAQKMRLLLLDESLRTTYKRRGHGLAQRFTWTRSADLFLSEVDHLESQ